MKRLFIVVCVLGVAYAGYTRYYVKKVEIAAAAPQGAGPIYVTMESDGPAFRLSPETRARVDRFSTEKVVLFGAEWCTYCAAERKLFAERGIRYFEVDIDRDPEGLRFMQTVLNVPAVPATVIGTRLIPGYNAEELAAAIRQR